ncbi:MULTISPECIES: DUF2267 domain-containing protein [Nocardiopsis]|jgi:uncharacterized protein (DUF2267 family)|uniref:DUF2267 domain-containing protein n=1 Tax=Nocardiopsis TaxID=2013 RepID=UPI000345949A|nr:MULTISPECIES: DUF2267 domain-containing protein [Nocardiopsis]MBQ1082311.1 DUF2267 domain-containing protein [Nocardiopsis sp. B62]
MRYDEFLAEVRDAGEYEDQREAEQVTRAVFSVLAQRLPGTSLDHLAAQIPEPLDEALRPEDQLEAEPFGVEEFHSRVAEETGARPLTAQQDSGAVLSTVAKAVSGGELNQLLSHLPSGYAVMFGKPELA